MNPQKLHIRKLALQMYWGEDVLLADHVPATLTWQPNLQVPSYLHLELDFNTLPYSFKYDFTPHIKQPLFFKFTENETVNELWVDEQEVKRYCRGYLDSATFPVYTIRQNIHPDLQEDPLTEDQRVVFHYLYPGHLFRIEETNPTKNSNSIHYLEKYSVDLCDYKWKFPSKMPFKTEVQMAWFNSMPVTLIRFEQDSRAEYPQFDYMTSVITYAEEMLQRAIALAYLRRIKPMFQIKGVIPLEERLQIIDITWRGSAQPAIPLYSISDPQKHLPEARMLFERFITDMRISIPVWSHYLREFMDLLSVKDHTERFVRGSDLLKRMVSTYDVPQKAFANELLEALNELCPHKLSRYYNGDFGYLEESIRGEWAGFTTELEPLANHFLLGLEPPQGWWNGYHIGSFQNILFRLISDLLRGMIRQ